MAAKPIAAGAPRPIAMPRGSVPVGKGWMKDGRPVTIVVLPTGALIPVVWGKAK